MKNPKNLLIVRTDRIGDVVLSLPLARIVKKHYPECRITFLLREYTRTLAEGNPYIDNIIILKTSNHQVLLNENISVLSAEKFDSVIVVYPTFIISLLIFLSGIPVRIGTGYRWYSFLFNKKIYEHRKNAEKHELEYNIGLLQHINIMETVKDNPPEFFLRISETAEKKVKDVLAQSAVNADDIIIIVHPGSGGSAVDLPANKFRELITFLSEKKSCQVLLTGSRNEYDKCESLVADTKVKNLAGLFNLEELTALINFSSVFIANSTGPLHIAAALNKYVIGFYPKVLACSPKRWGPYSNKGFVFTPEMECANCTVEQCIKLNCMNTIDMNRVFEKTEKILKLLLNTGDTDEK